MILMLMAVAAMALSAVAQEPSDAKLEAVAHAYLGVMEIQNEYGPQIQEAQSPDEAQALQQEATEKMLHVIKAQESVTVEEYNEILEEVQSNEELRNRFATVVESLTAERSEG